MKREIITLSAFYEPSIVQYILYISQHSNHDFMPLVDVETYLWITKILAYIHKPTSNKTSFQIHCCLNSKVQICLICQQTHPGMDNLPHWYKYQLSCTPSSAYRIGAYDKFIKNNIESMTIWFNFQHQ